MKKKTLRSVRALLLTVLLLAVALSLSSCFWLLNLNSDWESIYDKEELVEHIESCDGYKANNVVSYFAKWRFPAFDTQRLAQVESKFKNFYVEDLPEAEILANDMKDCFFEFFIDKIDLKDEKTVTLALIDCLIYSIGDDYAVYRTPDEYDDYSTDMSGEIIGIGVQVIFNNLDNSCHIESVTPGGGAEKAGILPGDYIVAVDDVRVSEMGYSKTLAAVRGEIDTEVKITVSREGEEISYTVIRSKIIEHSVTYSIDENKIGYIKITGFKENTTEQFKEAIDSFEAAGCVGVIYDLCDNPGGYLSSVVDMLSYISPKGTQIVSFSNNYSLPVKDTDEHEFLLPSVVICNKNTASAGELFTAAVRDFGDAGILDVTIVGEKSFGKGIMQTTFPFADGSTITMTVAYYNPPCGQNYHKVGITPDFICENMSKALDDAYSEINKLIK